MTVVGVDDTDSRERGMCTTYLASRLADRLRSHGVVERLLLLRCNPAVEHKTRGNAAVAIHVDCAADLAFEHAREVAESLAEMDDSSTNPGIVVADHDPENVPPAVSRFAENAVRDHLEIRDAESTIDEVGYRATWWGNGRGRIGALAAIGAWPVTDDGTTDAAEGTVDDGTSVRAAVGDWTYELIAYRESERWGTDRTVDAESVFAAAEAAAPIAWDTVDRVEESLVCVPNTPGPVLYGLRGDDPAVLESMAAAIESEPVASHELFVTNQGTDAHLRDGTVGSVADGRAYRVDGTVASVPETRTGGHVFFTLEDGADRLQCVAFEPTKRFRDRVRALRPGDRLTVCGEVSRGTLKLEKFAVRSLETTALRTPTCPECERTMESAGTDQGYRCRECGTTAPERERVSIERHLTVGWYEVPPCARRHVAKPLVRGGFDAPTHPER